MNYLKTWLTDLLCYTTCSALNLLNSPVWTTEHHFQIQVLHFSCVSLSKHIHCILFLFSFSHKREVQPFLSSHSEGYAEMYFTFLPLSSEQSFILCGLTLTIMEQECPIHDTCPIQLQHDPVAGSRETFAKVLLSSCKSRDNCKGFSGILQLSLSKIPHLWELHKYPLRNSFQGIN